MDGPLGNYSSSAALFLSGSCGLLATGKEHFTLYEINHVLFNISVQCPFIKPFQNYPGGWGDVSGDMSAYCTNMKTQVQNLLTLT